MDFLSGTAVQVVQVLVAALALGAGLPAMFALGLWARSPVTVDGRVLNPGPGRKALGLVCFGVVAVAIAVGIGYLVLTGHRG